MKANRYLLAVIVCCLFSINEGIQNCSEPCLIYSATSEINAIELTTSRVVNLVSNLARAVALDVHVSQKTIYWSDVQQHVIKRMSLETGNIEDIVTDDLGVVDGLAVEWASNLIYWTDSTNSRVEVASLDGSRRKLLFIEEVDKPHGIALYPKKGLMFWTDWGLQPKIERATLAGLNRTVLVDLRSSAQYFPNAIFVDYTEDRVYWIDALNDAIDSTDLNGNNRRTVSSPIHPSQDMHPFDFTVYGDILYWSDSNTDSIERLNWTTAAYLGRFGNLTSDRVFGVAFLHQSRQPASAGNQLCKVNNGGCSHLCLLTPGRYQCACPDGLLLQSAGKTCQTDFQKFLLFADAGSAGLLIKSLNGSHTEASAVPIPQHFNILRPVALDMDIRDNRIYWTDVTLHTISRVFMNGSSPEVLVSVNVSTPDGLAVDPLGGNIYWTDTGTDKIEVSRLDGSMRKILIDQNLDQPRDIILDLTKGLMYWCDWGVEHKIEFANMDGNERKLLVSSGLYYPSGLTLDHTNNWLYWMDAGYHALEYYDLENHVIKTLIISNNYLPHPFGLTLLDDYLYWTDTSKKAVFRTEKATPQYLTTVVNYLSQPMDIHAYDRNQTFPDHPCSLSYGGCSHLCLLRPNGNRCSCPDKLSHGEVCFTSPITSSSTSPSVSASMSASVLTLVSPSVSLSTSPSVSPSTSPSVSASTSLSPSVSTSTSASVSASMSVSLSPSTSPSVLGLTSLSPSVSPSTLLSPLASPSISLSPSVSALTSLSPSASPSTSLSLSVSSSTLLSPSVSPSTSLSTSLSASTSLSPSVSSSTSLSLPVSPSTSVSTSTPLSTSVSPSTSLSPSVSASTSLSTSVLTSTSLLPPVSTSASTSVSTSSSASSSQTTSVSQSDSPPVPLTESPATSTSVATPTSTCRLGTCRNGGTCAIPGYFCNCKKYFAWYDCSVNVAASALEMVLALRNENQWNRTQFQKAVAEACTKVFCKGGKCESVTKSGRARRSERAAHFKPTDVIIIETSFTKDNNFKVEFAVLFPSEDGKAPKVTPPKDIVQVAEEAKQSIEKAAGGTILSIVSKEIITETPTESIQTPKGAKSSDDKGSSAWPIAAGVGVTFVVMGILLAVVFYRIRGKLKISPDVGQHTVRDNPAFNEDPIYDSIPEGTGSSVQKDLRQATDADSQDLRFPDDRRNEVTNTIQISNRLYDAVGGNSAVRKIDDSKKQYATPGGGREQRYASLSPAQYRIALDMTGTKTDEEDYMKPVGGHYMIPQHNDAINNAVYESTKFQDESSV